MFNPDGARVSQWAEIDTTFVSRPETGFVENWGNALGLAVDRYLPFSSTHDVEGDWSDFFGSSRTQERTRLLQSYIADGTIPQEIKDQNTKRMPRTGKRTNWNEISKWANQNLKDDIDSIMTDEEYITNRNEILADRTRYVEDVQSQANWAGMVGQFAGGMHAMVLDPVTLVTLPLSGPAVGIARTSRAMYTTVMAARIAAFNMGIQIPMEVLIHDWNEEIGADYTWQDAGINILATGIFSGSIGGVAANLGHRFSGSYRGVGRDFLSKDRDSLVESFRKIGLEDAEAEAMASYQWEVNNAVDDPVAVIAKDLELQKKNNPEVIHTVEEKAIIKEGKAKADAEIKLREIEEVAIVKKEVEVIKKKIATAKKPKKVVAKKTEAETAGEKSLRQAQNKINATEKKLVASEKKLATAQKKFDDATDGSDQKVVTGKLLTRASGETEKARTLAEKAKENFADVEAEVGTVKKKAPAKEDNKAIIADAKEKVDWEFVDSHSEIVNAQKDGLITKKQEGLLLDEYFKKEGGIEKTIKAKVQSDLEPEVQNTKDFVEDLENHQENLNSRGQEVEDVEPVVKVNDEADVVDTLYDEIPDDLEYYIDGEPMRAKDLVDEYESDLDELNTVMECLTSG